MASRSAVEKWLAELTHLPTASGKEDAVVGWVERWASRRDDLRLTRDSGGNLIVTQKGRKAHDPILAVAHMDHPAFVATSVVGTEVTFEFRGWVHEEYFANAEVRFHQSGAIGRVGAHEAKARTGVIDLIRRFEVEPGDIALWSMERPPSRADIFSAPACDDLAGVAAALAALDKARKRPGLRHLGVMLTRAEEVGFLGALHAARHQTVPPNTRILSIETSRAMAAAPIGAGPVIRIGDRSSVFDTALTNRISRAAADSGINHQRKLMDGGACEATAFGAYGYQTTGLCVPLGNYHNQGRLDEVEEGSAKPVVMYEEISLTDFHGLVQLILLAAEAADMVDPLRDRLERHYQSGKDLLS